ncbi:uncharacterized protein LOC101744084 isoform X2 [Bombyx mori]|nr:uncharacterized protein LOC101744084 isoform X2 [Bombyx mori]XP_004927298.1 uncharacterized protein LOC101744084 isoform X2 [Bombyx mori]XP_012546785.1 uncharacterized protein LOC101744084 isoform X2 [Bombyx mori]XP_021204414.1 uncharacterized protein LOC101744084 isoform X2 [Bombyx mori]
MFQKSRLSIAFLTLISLFHKSTAIKCFNCNSANNSACLDVNDIDPEMRGIIIPVVHCETAIPNPVAQNFFCRKIVQTIYHPHHDSEIRVTRNCAWVPGDKECYTVYNSDHAEIVCQCFADYCNSADSTDPTSGTILFLALAACLYFYR